MKDRQFPILSKFHHWRKSIPWSLVADYEDNAMKNHSQTLERLAERGGFSPRELYAVVKGIRWTHKSHIWTMTEEQAMEIIDEWMKKDYGGN